MGDKRRVACLYRVSTLKQLDSDDIPMQRTACLSYIERQKEWQFWDDYVEKGVSGFKKSAANRDIIQKVLKDAAGGLFDILLVFKSDRISRISDEYNITVKKLCSKGIKVWSVSDGDLSVSTHMDSFISFTRGWSNEYESRRISSYVDEKHKQMTKDGQFRGGMIGYGYCLEKAGRFSERDKKQRKELYTPSINEKEARVVREMFSLVINEGYGGNRIANYLNQSNIPSPTGKGWNKNNVNYILRNPLFKGYPAYGKCTRKKEASGYHQKEEDWTTPTQQIEKLAIVSEVDWNTANSIRKSRTHKNRQEDVPLNYSTKSKLLLVGLIICGHCNKPLITKHHIKTWTNKDGSRHEKRYLKYCCSGQSTSSKRCDGQSAYSQQKIETILVDEINMYLASLQKMDFAVDIQQIALKQTATLNFELSAASKKTVRLEMEIDVLNKEIVKTLLNESTFKKDKLITLISEKEAELEEMKNSTQRLSEEKEKKRLEIQDMLKLKESIPSWQELFKQADINVKKKLLKDILKKVVVYRDSIQVHMRVDISEITSISNSAFKQNIRLVKGDGKIIEDVISVAF